MRRGGLSVLVAGLIVMMFGFTIHIGMQQQVVLGVTQDDLVQGSRSAELERADGTHTYRVLASARCGEITITAFNSEGENLYVEECDASKDENHLYHHGTIVVDHSEDRNVRIESSETLWVYDETQWLVAGWMSIPMLILTGIGGIIAAWGLWMCIGEDEDEENNHPMNGQPRTDFEHQGAL